MSLARWILRRTNAEDAETVGVFASLEAAQDYAREACGAAGPWRAPSEFDPEWKNAAGEWEYALEQEFVRGEPYPEELP